MKIAKQLLTFALAAFCMAACGKVEKDPEQQKPDVEKPDTGKDEEEDKPAVYTISLKAESEFYEVEFPTEAQEGETVTVTVTPVEDVFVDMVRYNSTKATPVEGKENTFEFTMPKKNVSLTVNTSSTVTVLPSSYFTGVADKEIAAAGDLVTVAFYVNNIEDAVASAKVNGSINCTLAAIDLGEYVFTLS